MTEVTATLTGLERLHLALRRISNKAQVAAGLGIKDPDSQDEEFWKNQKRAARSRFFQLCLQELGWDESERLEDLDAGLCHVVADTAEQLLTQPSFDYALVRRWFLRRGQFQQAKARSLRHERQYVEDSALRVLVILNGGGAMYLGYGPGPDDVKLVGEAEAHEFPVSSVSEMTKGYLLEMATHFEALKKLFDIKEIKVLASAKRDLA